MHVCMKHVIFIYFFELLCDPNCVCVFVGVQYVPGDTGRFHPGP